MEEVTMELGMNLELLLNQLWDIYKFADDSKIHVHMLKQQWLASTYTLA